MVCNYILEWILQELSMAKDNKKSQRFFFGFVLGKKMRVVD